MARKVLNRKELRAQAESADLTSGGVKKKVAKKKKTTTKRSSRTKKQEKVVRMKMFWGVFNQSLKRVALYEFSQKKQAEKKATQLTASQKTPHFIQRVKEAVKEAVDD